MRGCMPESRLSGRGRSCNDLPTALATKLRRADNQPLACGLTLHNTSDIYKVSISLIAACKGSSNRRTQWPVVP